jgi:hypothetical protein
LSAAERGAAQAIVPMIQNGDPANRLDLVIVGDGYTANEMGAFASQVSQFVAGMFVQDPFREYQRYFNVKRMDIVSPESGADHPEQSPAVFRNTAFDATYNCWGTQRLICVDTSKVITAVSVLPPAQRDIVLVIVNDAQYGGSGGSVPVASIHADSVEIVLHELGHTIGLLGDEYGGSSCVANGEPSEPNVTSQTDPSMIKWNAWIDEETSVPTVTNSPAEPGLYLGSRYCDNVLYRPTYNSKMRSLNLPFDQINSEQMVLRFYDFASPIDSVSPASTYISLAKGAVQNFSVATPTPFSHSLNISWLVDGQLLGTTPGFVLNTSTLAAGSHTVDLVVRDGTSMVRNDPEGLLSEEASWTVDVTAANSAPSVNAGPNKTTLKSTPLTLVGAVDDDGLPSGSPVTVRWTKVSGPGSVSFSASRALVTTVSFSAKGTYKLRLTASDGQLSAFDEVQIVVK